MALTKAQTAYTTQEQTNNRRIDSYELRQNYVGQQFKILIDDDLDFIKAKDAAKQKVKEISPESMLLSWYIGKTGEHYPTLKCGTSHKPAWLLYAEARGGDITIMINNGEYIFVFLSLH